MITDEILCVYLPTKFTYYNLPMKQNEAVRLALHILGGKARLDKITLNSLMLKHVDWTQTATPDASIRRIVRNDDYIRPVAGMSAWYELIKPLSAELIADDQLADDWLERIVHYRKVKEQLAGLTALLNQEMADHNKTRSYLDALMAEMVDSLPIKTIVDFCLASYDQDRQGVVKLVLYDVLGESITPKQRKWIEPLGKKEHHPNIQNNFYRGSQNVEHIDTQNNYKDQQL